MGEQDKAPEQAPEPAGLKLRILALALDAFLLAALLLPLNWWLRGDAQPGTAATWILGAVKWVLPTLLVLVFWHRCGATPGKQVCGIHIVDAPSGGRASPGQLGLRWLLWVLSALPLGLGFLWGVFAPTHRCLHEQWSRTQVLRVPPSPDPNEAVEPSEAKAPSFWQAVADFALSHWRGEQPLALSFWRNTLLLLLPLLALAMAMAWHIHVSGHWPGLASAVLLLTWTVLLLVLPWAVGGCWRAANVHVRLGHEPQHALAAHAGLVALSAVLMYASAWEVLPQVGQYLQLARGAEPLGHAAITLSADGSRLTVKGALGRGDGAEFRRIASGAERLKVVELESVGGRLAEAQRMADAVQARRLRTRATGRCDGACALVFMAGTDHQIVPTASVALSPVSAGLLSPLLAGPVSANLAARYRAVGMPETFIAHLLQASPGVPWRPTRAQWADAGLIDPEPPTLDVSLPAAGTTDVRFELGERLHGHPTWYWLDRYLPGLIDAAAERMAAALGERDEAQAQAQAQALVSALLPGLLQSASNELRVAYLALWAEQLKAARQQGPAQCTALLAGDAAARRALPEPLLGRENEWLVQAAMQGSGADFRPVNANEQVVLRHRLGERAPVILAGLFQAMRKGPRPQDCQRSIEILELVNALPLNIRPLAARAIFQD